jgi:hypothetical protein
VHVSVNEYLLLRFVLTLLITDGQSKLANILFTTELQKRFEAKGITNVYVNSIHPGIVRTNLGHDIEMPAWSKSLMSYLPFFKSPEDGALTQVINLCSSFLYYCELSILRVPTAPCTRFHLVLIY